MPTIITTRTASLWTEQRGCGEDVVLLAGLCDDAFVWGPVIDRLADSYRVTVVDQRKTGRSLASPRILHYVEDLRTAIEHLGLDRVHIVGTCLGAIVAQEFAAAYPDRVRSLVLNGTWRGGDPHFQGLLSSWIWTAQHAQTQRELLEVVALSASTPDQWERGDVAAELDRGQRMVGLDFFAFRRGFVTAARTLRAYDAADRLRRIDAPALVTVGALDAVRPPAHGREVASEISGAHLEVIPGVGRRPFVEEPERYADLVEGFLGSPTRELALAA